MQKESYRVKVANFEGPFGVLLSLVEERKLHISDVSLAQVTEDYLKYVNGLENIPPDEMSAFIVVAATLILIKSKSLLPNLSLTEEEESDIRNLEDRLKLYEQYISLTRHIKDSFGRKIIFPAEERRNQVLVFLPDKQITKEKMMEFAQQALGKLPSQTFLPEVEVKKMVSIEEMIGRLTDRITNSLKMNFKEFAKLSAKRGRPISKEEKVFAIVSFLAVLELVRQGTLRVVQAKDFEDIIISKEEILIDN